MKNATETYWYYLVWVYSIHALITKVSCIVAMGNEPTKANQLRKKKSR